MISPSLMTLDKTIKVTTQFKQKELIQNENVIVNAAVTGLCSGRTPMCADIFIDVGSRH